ncbi:hypothetical protein LCGC14_1520330 [marine sediment metagenome]|uniref:Uncharacterized protein n=2 Tax=root TaxID=1 RepID=A0A831QNI8_9FLAO|nr:hypothetical protein [Pricia antarctica]
MRYFSISATHDLGIIGHYSQTKLKDGYNPTLHNSHWQVRADEFPDFVPNLELEIDKKAKPTNFLDGASGFNGFLVDKPFKSILEKFRLPPHHFYP